MSHDGKGNFAVCGQRQGLRAIPSSPAGHHAGLYKGAQHRLVLCFAHHWRPVGQPVPLVALPDMGDPESRMRIGARPTTPAAPGAADGMPKVVDRERVRQTGKCRDRNEAGVNT